jgi:hypothetical protein
LRSRACGYNLAGSGADKRRANFYIPLDPDMLATVTLRRPLVPHHRKLVVLRGPR